MRIPLAIALLLAIPTALLAQESTSESPRKKPWAPPAGVAVQTDLPYSETTAEDGSPVTLHLDLYTPEDRPTDPEGKASALPCVIWVHGGGWKNGSKDRPKAAWLATEGFVVASVEYRLTDVAGWPAQIDDPTAAILWLRENATDLGIDPENIGVWGSSAGGHLAALLGTRPDAEDPARVQAVCDWFGPSDLMTMPPNNVGDGRSAEDVAKSNGALLLRATVREVPDLAHDASALHHVSPDDPPFLIMHGSEDPGVPLDQSERLHAALLEAGATSELLILGGAKHGGPQFQTPAAQAAVLAFFEAQLKP